MRVVSGCRRCCRRVGLSEPGCQGETRRVGRAPVIRVARAASMVLPRYQSPVWSRL